VFHFRQTFGGNAAKPTDKLQETWSTFPLFREEVSDSCDQAGRSMVLRGNVAIISKALVTPYPTVTIEAKDGILLLIAVGSTTELRGRSPSSCSASTRRGG